MNQLVTSLIIPKVHQVTYPFPFTNGGQEANFLSKILPPDENGCRVWAGMSQANAGLVHFGKKELRAHRVAYMYYLGPIPENHQVHQTCGNKFCLTKEHLIAVPNPTKKEKPPAKEKQRKFDPETIRKIRKMRHESFTLAQIADCFNTTAPTVLNICKFKAYAHVPPEDGLELKQLP
jgi:hypothetical protein